MRRLYRAKGREGICLVTDAIAGAGLPEGAHFSLYGIECRVAGGVGIQRNQLSLAGSISRMVDVIRTMVENVDVPLHETIAMATLVPARVIGLEAKGRLQVGGAADFVVLSPELEVLETYLGGERIFAEAGGGALKEPRV
jgi:N-acetylglucosamine-6-phosphate deacetylase